jgi:hypothetical protein
MKIKRFEDPKKILLRVEKLLDIRLSNIGDLGPLLLTRWDVPDTWTTLLFSLESHEKR